MTRRASNRFRRICFWNLITAVTLSGPLTTSTRAESIGNAASSVEDIIQEELCGWATHDSCPLSSAPRSEPEVVEEPIAVTPVATETPPSRPAAMIETSLASIATAACATAGISVEQIVEPFAMVGPHLADSLQRVNEFQSWWQEQAAKQADEPIASEHAAEYATEQPTEHTQAQQQFKTTAADPVVENVASPSDLCPAEVSHVPIVDFESEIAPSEPWSENLASATEADSVNDVESVDDSQIDTDSADDHRVLVKGNDEEIRDELIELATEEPVDTIGIDTEVFGPSVLLVESAEQVIETEQPIDSVIDAVESTDDSVSANDHHLVGTAPMIFSIDEAYLPYDLAVRDYQLDSLSSLAKRPFCVLSRVELSEQDFVREAATSSEPVERDDLDEVQLADAANSELDASFECLLDEGLSSVTLALENGGAVRKWLRPETVGRQVAAFVVKHNELTSELVSRLAEVWPEASQSQSPAGALLLARAGAVEAVQHHAGVARAKLAAQLAKVSKTTRQWISVIDDVVTDLRGQWQQIAQAPPQDSASQAR